MRSFLVVMIIGGVALVLTTVAFRQARSGSDRPVRLLSRAALGSTVLIGLAVLPVLLADPDADSGGDSDSALGGGVAGILATTVPPVVIAGLAALATKLGNARVRAVAGWVGAALMLAFIVVHGLDVGFYYWPSAMLLFANASVVQRLTTVAPRR